VADQTPAADLSVAEQNLRKLTETGVHYLQVAISEYEEEEGSIERAAAAAAISCAASHGAGMVYVGLRDHDAAVNQAAADEWRAADARRFLADYEAQHQATTPKVAHVAVVHSDGDDIYRPYYVTCNNCDWVRDGDRTTSAAEADSWAEDHERQATPTAAKRAVRHTAYTVLPGGTIAGSGKLGVRCAACDWTADDMHFDDRKLADIACKLHEAALTDVG
jgi:hypothetical protein